MTEVVRRPTVLVLGEKSHSDFSEVFTWLAAYGNVVQDVVTSQSPIDCAVFFQTRPGQMRQQVIEKVHSTWPMAGLAVVLGSWCEGETRSGRPIHGVQRMFWYEAK